MKKLSVAQQLAMDELHKTIAEAKELETFEEFFYKYIAPHCNCDYNTIEKSNSHDPHYLDSARKYWEARRKNIAIIYANTRTIQSLSKMGYIEVIEIGGVCADYVRVLK